MAARRIEAVTARLMLVAAGSGKAATWRSRPYHGARIVPARITYIVHPDQQRVTVTNE